ncbi:MAG TPA: hypothetical protein ENL03_00360 [Phycisphaerae bacterium]|nr:hypothetical protein [Phycisphaerae bacterium]
MGKRVYTLLILLFIALPAGAKENWNVDIFIGWGSGYRPGQWTPITIAIQGKGFDKPFTATISVTTQQDDLNNMIIHTNRVISPSKRLIVPISAKFASFSPDCNVTITDEDGNLRWGKSYSIMSYGSNQGPSIKRRLDEEMIIAVAGKSLKQLTDFRRYGLSNVVNVEHDTNRNTKRRMFVHHKVNEQLPWDWTGYASLDAMVLNDVDLGSEITPGQAQAIATWVRSGGNLVIVVGSNQLPKDNPITKLLGVTLGPSLKVKLPSAAIDWLGLRGAGITETSCWTLAKEPQRGWEIKCPVDPGSSLCIQGRVGFGQIHLLLFNPANMYKGLDTQGRQFWASQLNDICDERKITCKKFPLSTDAYSSEDEDSVRTQALQCTNHVLGHLYAIPELRPLSIWWIIGLLAALAMILGPVDYLLLKWLDRQPWTWVTTAVVICLFTGGAYYAAHRIRGSAMQVRVVTITDGIAADGDSWTTCYAGVFAPSSDLYNIAGLDDNQWWSASNPTDQYRDQWDDDVTASRNISYNQNGKGNRPAPIPINIWSMQTMLGEYRSGSMPISATIELDNGFANPNSSSHRQISIQINNLVDTPIASGKVVFKDGWELPFESIEANGQLDLKGRLNPGRRLIELDTDDRHSDYEDDYYYEYAMDRTSHLDRDSALFAQGVSTRTRRIDKYLQNGSAMVMVEYEKAPLKFTVSHGRGGQYHVWIARLVITPDRSE